jgi:hypothetical protein
MNLPRDTATDAGRETRERHLLERPQLLGILPTWWFWNDRENWRLVRWPFAVFVFISALVLTAIALPLVAEIAIFVSVFCLGLGSLEKHVRRQALKRRELAEKSATQDALQARGD